MSRAYLVPILLPADPQAAMEAATKQYVDGKVGGSDPDWTLGYATYDPRYVNVGGDTMTGTLTVPTVSGASSLNLNGTTGGVTIDGAGARCAQFTTAGAVYIGDTVTAANNGNVPLRIYGNAGACQIQFYQGAVVANVGMATATEMRLQNTVASGLLTLWCNAGDVRMAPSGVESARFNGTWFLMNKTTNDQAIAGLQINGNDACNVVVSNNVGSTPMFACNKIGAGVSSGHDYVHFRNNGTAIGSITRNGTTAAVLYNTSSDYRLKEDRGLITSARERIKVLRPRRVIWKEDETRQEQDAFFAHEVAEAVPEAVTGEKDGDEMQMLDATKLIPLLTAALQEAWAQIDKLTARVSALEMA